MAAESQSTSATPSNPPASTSNGIIEVTKLPKADADDGEDEAEAEVEAETLLNVTIVLPGPKVSKMPVMVSICRLRTG